MEEQKDKNSDYLYLSKLEFKPELRKTWLNFFVTNFRVVILLIILVSMWGIYSFNALPRESNPEVKIPIAVVSVVYPGVGPSDMEELVTKKIETSVGGIKGIKKLTSNSANSISSITVEFNANENIDDSIRKLRDQVTNVKKDLPADANEPVVTEVSFDDRPIWTIQLTGPYDGFTIRRYADEIKDELEKISGVREVNVSGGDEKEYSVSYDQNKLLLFGVSADQANNAIKARNIAVPAGTIETGKLVYPIRSDARFFTAEDLRQTPVGHNEDGTVVYLSDIAEVKETAIKKTVLSRVSIDGKEAAPSVTIGIVKKTGASILDTVDEAKNVIDNKVKTFPQGVQYTTGIDFSKQIRTQFDQLSHDFLLTIILVSIILFLVVGIKEAFVAGLAVPLVFFITFGMLNYYGISLNFLSIFSLLLSLGLLVDDAIVVVSATKQYLRTGKFTPEEAVLLVLNDFKVVLTTTTLTTVWAFLPLLSASGIIGQFIKSIPITVSIILISSLLVALMINHPLAAVLERLRLTRNMVKVYILLLVGAAVYLATNQSVWIELLAVPLAIGAVYLLSWMSGRGRERLIRNEELAKREWQDDGLIKEKLRLQGSAEHRDLMSRLFHGILSFEGLLPIYEKYLRIFTRTKKTRRNTLLATLAVFVFAVSLPILGVVPTEFFPASDEDIMTINGHAPTGTRLDETSRIVAEAESRLMKYHDIESFSTLVGGGVNLSNASGGSSGSSHTVGITVNLIDKKARSMKSYELADKVRADLKAVDGMDFVVESVRGGPPSGAAFEARIIGDDLQQLDKIANDFEPILKQIKGVTDTDISLKDSPAEYTFRLDPRKLEIYNLNAAYVGSMLRLAVNGTEVTTVIKGGDEYKVVARFNRGQLPDLKAIQNIQILNLRKQPVYLKDVAQIELKPSVNAVTRIDQKRYVGLTAGVSANALPAEVLKTFQDKIKDYKFPENYSIEYGGENEQNNESVLSILRAMVIAGLLIVSTLIIQFNSFKKAIIVLVTIPLALIGTFIGMAMVQVTLSFPGLIGILALFGIVVKNAIILVDKINLNLKSGIEFEAAIIDAGKSRLEAIVITSICTIMGLIPVTLSNATWTALGSAVIFGLMLSSFLTLFIVPTLYMVFIRPDERV
jgi:HAE1 family hydrophobic/amphiphilic exporter-1